ncbi:MAG: GTPase ObgE, partial [Firmicutes bacterium]|nr:GTPase ObgE [Bacillota bacterium]
YKYKRKFVAENGKNGMADKFHGGNGADIELPVPPGTVVLDAESGLVIADMTGIDRFVLCKGGRGGWGNRHFATPTRQIPRFAKSGVKGEEKEVILELKMLADVGLIGLPSVGKSSILARISAARPKIADYHFTTLSPNLGVVRINEHSNEGFVAADIPGLIEGASEGAGLGHDFLRHIDRCRLLLHVVDASGTEGRDPVDDIILINNELKKYSEKLAERPQIIVANKYDAIPDGRSELTDRLENYADENGLELIYVSAATGYNMGEMVQTVVEKLKLLPPMTVYEAEYTAPLPVRTDTHEVEIRFDDGIWVVEGEWLWNLVGSVNFEDRDSLGYFQRVLKNSGTIEKLEAAGVKDGDTVSIYDFEFDFVK